MNIINKSDNELPTYGTSLSAGLDLRADLAESVKLEPLERMIIPTGLFIELPPKTVGLVCPRSGLAAKHGISIVNAPGIIDEDFKGELKVILINLSNESFTINHGDRIAQLVLTEYKQVSLELTDKLQDTQRGEEGFGHTGIS